MSISTIFATPKVARAADVAPVAAFGDKMWHVLSSEDTGHLLEVSICETQPGSGSPLHVHTVEDEIFYIQSGIFEFNIGGKKLEVGPGAVVFAPRFVPHNFRCVSTTAGRMTVVFTPGNFHSFFSQCAAEFEAGTPDFDRIVEISADHGIHYMPPTEVAEYMSGVPSLQPKVIRPNSGERLTVPGGAFRFILEAEETGGQVGMLELETPSNAGPPLHIHNFEDELFLVQEGHYEFQLDNVTVQAGPGDIIWAPRPYAHAFRAIGKGPSRMLTLLLPGGFENYFRRLHKELNRRGYSRELMLELHEEYGLENPVR